MNFVSLFNLIGMQIGNGKISIIKTYIVLLPIFISKFNVIIRIQKRVLLYWLGLNAGESVCVKLEPLAGWTS